MKRTPEYIEGPEAWTRFDALVDTVFSVPREEMLRRESEYRKQVDANPRRRGPKRKAITPTSASPAPPA
jgi:hypothetical protein